MNQFLIDKKKFAQTSKNSRQNSGEKQIARIMSLKHSKMNTPNSAGGTIKPTIKKKKPNNGMIIYNNINNKNKGLDKINDINNNKSLHNNYIIPYVNINFEKNIIKKDNNKIISKQDNNYMDIIQNNLPYNNPKNKDNENNDLLDNNINLNNENRIDNKKSDIKNNSNIIQSKIKDNKFIIENYYSNENNKQIDGNYEQIKKGEKIIQKKKKILLGKNYISNLPPSSRQIIFNKTKFINDNSNNNNNNNTSNSINNNNNINLNININDNIINSTKDSNINSNSNATDSGQLKKIYFSHQNKFINFKTKKNDLKNQIINNDNNSLEEIKDKDKDKEFNKGLLIKRKIMTATNSPSHSLQINNCNTNNNNNNNSNLNKNPLHIKSSFIKNINNKNKTNYNSNNYSKNTTIYNINENNNNHIANTNSSNISKNELLNMKYTKPVNREIIHLNENGDKNIIKNKKIIDKNTITNTSSSNNTNNSRKNTTGKIKINNNEKIINKNKIHNYINNQNIINNEQQNNNLFNPHHNTLRSNNSTNNKENANDLDNNNINNKVNNVKNKGIINGYNNNNNNINNDINYNLNINQYINENNSKNTKLVYNKTQKDKNDKDKDKEIIQKQKDKIKLDKLTQKIITGKIIKTKINCKSIGINNNIKSNKNDDFNKFFDKEKIEQLLLKKDSKNINININVKDIQKDENKKYTKPKVKAAKKSTHNRNMEQNYILNNRTNTTVLSTMKDSNYYNHECEILSKYIKDYYKQNSKYPDTDLSFYKYGRIIGRGAFGKVNIGLNVLTGRIVAIKSFNKKNIISESSKKKILYETNLMRGLFHPSVTKILETFESENYMLIIMEYISGGNLQNFVKKRRKLGEKTAKILFRQIIQGIKYIHSRGIVHRDIKLENILLDLNNIIKICDFGVGKLIKPSTILKDQCGTPVYMAPEIIKGQGYHGFPVDIWSAGVALYIMLSGTLPFNKDKEKGLEYNILNNEIAKINGVSEDANNLLKNILEKDPNKRYTANQILEHPWMNTNLNDDESNDYDYNNGIKNVNKYHLFTNAESILLAKTHIDYRNAQKKDLAENFTINNLFTLDEKNKKNVDTKSAILAPYNSMLTENEENEDNLNSNNSNKKIKNSKNNGYELLDNFSNELQIKNGLIKFHGKAKEFNMNYELNNNEEIDNGMLINSKNELLSTEKIKNEKDIENVDDDEEKNIYVIKNNNNNVYKNKNKNLNIQKKQKHRPSSPYRPPPINKNVLKMVSDLGYDQEYVIQCLEKNELNHATTIYYLFSNYENVK